MKLELLSLEKNNWKESINYLKLELCVNMFKIVNSKHTNKRKKTLHEAGSNHIEIINCKGIR